MSSDEPTWRGNFFSLDRQQWSKALDLGMSSAVAYMMIAQGAHSSGTRSKWSARSIANRTGLSWKNARAAIDKLCLAGLLRQTSDDPLKPNYAITTPDERPPGPNVIQFTGKRVRPTRKVGREELIWLPCRIVEDDDDKTPILERLRQEGSVSLLRLLTDLYYFNDLPTHGGVDPSLIHFSFERSRIGERGPYTIWGFEYRDVQVERGTLITPYLTGKTRGVSIEKRPYRNDTGWASFIHEIDQLRRLGLALWVPQAFESDEEDAARLHPFGCYGGHPDEKRVAAEARGCAMALLNARGRAKADKVGPAVFPVLNHRGAPVLRAVLRLRHLPHTSMTADWLDQSYEWRKAASGFVRAAEVYGKAEPSPR